MQCMKIQTNSIRNQTDRQARRKTGKVWQILGERERESVYIMLMLIAAESAPRLTATTIASDNKNQMLLKASLPLTTKQAEATSWHADADSAGADAKQQQKQQQ